MTKCSELLLYCKINKNTSTKPRDSQLVRVERNTNITLKTSFLICISLKTCFLQLLNKYSYNRSPNVLGSISQCINILLSFA